MIRNKVRQVVETRDSKLGLFFDYFVIAAISFVAVLIVVESIPAVSRVLAAEINFALAALSFLFLLEYLLRLWIAEQRMRFIFSFWGIVDLIAIAPIFLSIFDVTLNLLMVRMLRLLRLFTLLKIARYNGSLRTFAVAFSLAREQLVLTLCAAFLVILVASAGIYQFEHEAQPEVFVTFFDALWWSVATLTTVGYGDIFPITAGGKAFTTLVLFVGLGVVALPAGIIAAALTEAKAGD